MKIYEKIRKACDENISILYYKGFGRLILLQNETKRLIFEAEI